MKKIIYRLVIKFLSTKIFSDIYFDFNRYVLPGFYRMKLHKCGNNVVLRTPLIIENMENVDIGNDVSIASYVHIWGGGGVKIGDNTMIASHVAIISIDHDYHVPEMHKTVIKKPVFIGNNVWIGAHSVIFPGVSIGDGAVIGAGSIARNNIPKNAVVCGMPGKIKKYRAIYNF